MKKTVLDCFLATLPVVSFASPKYIKTTDHIAFKSTKPWQWTTFTTMPAIKKWRNKKPVPSEMDKAVYEIKGDLNKYDTF